MSEETQLGSDPAPAQEASPAPAPATEGTTEQGQPSQSSGATANDPNAFQADYTQKYQSLAEDRKAFEAEKAAYQQPQYNQGYQQAQPQYTQVPQQQADPLVDQFGYEGAEAIRGQNQQILQQTQQAQYQALYQLEEFKGKQQFGEEGWNNHNYIDPRTGETKNRVMDVRLSYNPLNGQSLTLEQAWNAVNPVNPQQVAQQATDKAYQEMDRKQDSTPASTNVAPSSSGAGHADSVESAFLQALDES